MICIAMKYFIIYFCSVLIISKINNIVNKSISILILPSLLCSLFILGIKQLFPAFTIIFLVFFVFLFIRLVKKQKIESSLFLSIISTAIGFVLYHVAQLIISPIIFILISKLGYNDKKTLIDVLSEFLIIIISFLLCFFLLKNKRLVLGFSRINDSKNIDVFLYLGILLLLFFTLLFSNSDTSIVYIIPILCILFSAVAFFFILKSKIMNMYVDKLKEKEVLALNTTIEKLRSDNELMAKQIHKDNKILPIMQLSLTELFKEYGDTIKIKELQSQINILTRERNEVISTSKVFSSFCNITSTNNLFKYFYSKGINENISIDFDISIDGLDEEDAFISDINTVLSDLLENAIIAVRSMDCKRIFLNMKYDINKLTISIMDSGEHFSSEVLNKMGKEKITTHAHSGGSGIGLFTIHEIVNKYNGTFNINKYQDEYTKEIVVTLSL